MATYWKSLADTAEEILPWYPDHGTMEQYHAEYKTDLDLHHRPPVFRFQGNGFLARVEQHIYRALQVVPAKSDDTRSLVTLDLTHYLPSKGYSGFVG